MLAQEKQQGLPTGPQTRVSHQGAHAVYSKSPLSRETEHEPGHVCDTKSAERRDVDRQKSVFPPLFLFPVSVINRSSSNSKLYNYPIM